LEHGLGDYERGEALLRRVVTGRERVLGPLDLKTLEALQHLADVLHKRGRLDEARQLYLEEIGRCWKVFGPCHIRVSQPMGSLFAVLRQQRDTVAIRDNGQGWLRDILATPPDADAYLRSRRSVRVSGLSVRLVTLPDPIPFDADLAVRAAEEAVALNGDGDGFWPFLAVVYYRLGRLDDAMRAIQTSMARPPWKGGDGADWLVLAGIHARRGELNEARAWFDRALNKDPNRRPGGDLLEPLRLEVAALLGVAEPPKAKK
jgi:tetratricopeptide (TPR) repeat protein